MKYRIFYTAFDYYISYITNLNLLYNHFRGPNQVSELMFMKGTLRVFSLLPVRKTRGRIEGKNKIIIIKKNRKKNRNKLIS